MYRAIWTGHSYLGKPITRTPGGLTKSDLMLNSKNVVVSKKSHRAGVANFAKNGLKAYAVAAKKSGIPKKGQKAKLSGKKKSSK
jgi:hypothetical protein